MIKSFFRSLAAKNRDLIVEEGEQIRGFMHLLVKHRNTGQKWSPEETEDLKNHVKRLSLMCPS